MEKRKGKIISLYNTYTITENHVNNYVKIADICDSYLNEIKSLQSENQKMKKAITKAVSGLEYAAYNLTKTRYVDKLPPGITESTGSEDTLLIELRDLKLALETNGKGE